MNKLQETDEATMTLLAFKQASQEEQEEILKHVPLTVEEFENLLYFMTITDEKCDGTLRRVTQWINCVGVSAEILVPFVVHLCETGGTCCDGGFMAYLSYCFDPEVYLSEAA